MNDTGKGSNYILDSSLNGVKGAEPRGRDIAFSPADLQGSSQFKTAYVEIHEDLHLASAIPGVSYGDRYVPGREVDTVQDVNELNANHGDSVHSAAAAALFTMGAWGD